MSPSSTRIAAALLGASVATFAIAAPLPTSSPASSSPPPNGHAQPPKDSPMQSEAMHDALGLAMQAFRFAATHPDASEADKQAKASEIMSRLFQRELRDGDPTPADRHTQQPATRDDGGG